MNLQAGIDKLNTQLPLLSFLEVMAGVRRLKGVGRIQFRANDSMCFVYHPVQHVQLEGDTVTVTLNFHPTKCEPQARYGFYEMALRAYQTDTTPWLDACQVLHRPRLQDWLKRAIAYPAEIEVAPCWQALPISKLGHGRFDRSALLGRAVWASTHHITLHIGPIPEARVKIFLREEKPTLLQGLKTLAPYITWSLQPKCDTPQALHIGQTVLPLGWGLRLGGKA